jgi:penicillin G amidase
MRVMKRTLLFVVLIPACAADAPLASIPITDTINNTALSAPVDVVRDEHGIPHIYGKTLPDVGFVEGYLMGQDRLVQMDLVRHFASGTLAEIGGELSPALIDQDIFMRLHHMKKTSQDAFATLQQSADPVDQLLSRTLTSFAAGVNAYVADLQNGRYTLPPALAFAYDPTTWQPWTEADSIVIGRLISFQLSFDADSEIARAAVDAAAQARFTATADAVHAARAGIERDLQILEATDKTHTLENGWSSLLMASADAPAGPDALALLLADRPAVRDFGNDRWLHPQHGSNNWVVGPKLTASGHTLVANDPHLGLQNPATFWLVHLVADDAAHPVDVMGAQFPGIPGIILGMNQHVAWGATTSNLDVTDVYRETVAACSGGSGTCVTFQGAQVPLVPRVEQIKVGKFGAISRTLTVTFFDVPHHGPILPRVLADHSLEALGSSELSIRWTGHEPTMEVRALFGLDTARSVAEARAAVEGSFKVGGQNWVLGDDQGHFGWTEAVRLPRRPAGTVPWKVLPGDGTAEWLGDLDLNYVPHAFDPAQGFLATANGDPIGVTDDNEPFASEPVVDGIPLYLGADWDPGTRVGRIVKQLEARSADHKLTADDLQAIQADAVSEFGQLLAPTFLDAANALLEEIATPGAHPELTALVTTADAPSKAALAGQRDLVMGWSGDTPAGTDDAAPSAAQVADSRAALLLAVWQVRLADLALTDELSDLGMGIPDSFQQKLLVKMCTAPQALATGVNATTGDSVLFDDMTTAPIESKRQIAAAAIFDTLDYLLGKLGADATTWRWGTLHTLTLSGLVPLAALQIPLAGDAQFPNGFPRHGDNGTVDVGHHGFGLDDFTYGDGPNIRFVGELAPSGPRGRDVLPGGEVFDPQSPHYRDQLDLWVQNRTFDMAFAIDDVLASARREIAANGGGRVQFKAK